MSSNSKFGRRSSSVESSASSSYELDLPPIPPSYQQKPRYLSWGPGSPIDSDSPSPMYSKIIHQAFPNWESEEEEEGEGEREEGSRVGGGRGGVGAGERKPSLNTIVELEDRGEDDEYVQDMSSFNGGNYFTASSTARAITNLSSSPPGKLVEDENKYSPLRQSLLNPESIYTAPSYVDSNKEQQQQQQSAQHLLPSKDLSVDTQDSCHKSHASEYTAFPAITAQSHSSNNNSNNISHGSNNPEPPKRRTLPWLRPTWKRSYMRMQMVRHMDTACCSHPGAKKFCSVVVSGLCILLVAIGAVTVSVVSWHLL